MLRTLTLAAAALLATLGFLELGLRVARLEVHDLMHEARKYGSLLVLDARGRYLRHPAGASVVLQGVTLRFNRAPAAGRCCHGGRAAVGSGSVSRGSGR